MLELVVQNDNPQPRDIDRIKENAYFMRFMLSVMATMDAKEITAADWNNVIESASILCSAVETLANLNGRE